MKKLLLLFLLTMISVPIMVAQTVVTGKILGYDGKPMQRADVHLTTSMSTIPTKSVEAKSDGSYSLSIDEDGYFFVIYTGVDHQNYSVPLIAEKNKKTIINVQLKHNVYPESLSNVEVIGSFNNYDRNSALELTKQSDGTFTKEIKSDSSEISYELLGITNDNRSVNGTQPSEYKFDKTGDYESIIKVDDGVAKIIFDPSKLVRSKSEEKITFGDANTYDEDNYEILTAMGKRQDHFMQLVKQAGGKMPASVDWTKEADSIKSTFGKIKSPITKQLAILSYLQLALFGQKTLDSKIVESAFTKIKPSSLLWAVDPRILGMSFGYGDFQGSPDFTDSVVSENPNRDVVGFVLFMKISQAKYSGDQETAKKLYSKLVNEYGDTQFGMVAKRLPIDTKIEKGKKVPDFEVVSYEDSSKTISNKSLLGHVYMIDFWASWCKPCLGEMPNLQEAYNKYKDKGFEILSLSFDQKPEDVAKFRKGQWKMPWLHSYVTGGFSSQLAQEFGVKGIPKPILVDTDGTIIASENELRGPNLIKVLDAVFAEKK